MALPVNEFKSALVHLTSDWAAGYNVPTGKKSLLLEVDICNTTSPPAAIVVSVGIAKSNVSNDPEFLLLNESPIPAGSTVSVILGQKIVLEEAGQFTKLVFKTGVVGQTADATISVMQDIQ